MSLNRMSMISIKHMVLTLPARGSFSIRARHKRLGSGVGFLLPHTARAGRTCEALAFLWHGQMWRKEISH
jgi:hypothetical protein